MIPPSPPPASRRRQVATRLRPPGTPPGPTSDPAVHSSARQNAHSTVIVCLPRASRRTTRAKRAAHPRLATELAELGAWGKAQGKISAGTELPPTHRSSTPDSCHRLPEGHPVGACPIDSGDDGCVGITGSGGPNIACAQCRSKIGFRIDDRGTWQQTLLRGVLVGGPTTVPAWTDRRFRCGSRGNL